MSDNHAECEAILRRDDPDRAVAAAFAPVDRRRHLAALYAFDIETARIRQIVSQPLPGEIRLQWWRDRVAAYASDPLETGGQGSPVAAALLETIDTCGLPPAVFETLLDARIFDLYDDPMPDRATLEAYAGETASAVMMLAAMILDREAAPQASETAGHAGVARVAVEAMRLLGKRPQHAQIFFPADILTAVGCMRDDLMNGDEAATAGARAAMAAFAREHLKAAERGLSSLPRSLRPAFLPLALMAAELKHLESPAGSHLPRRMAAVARLLRYWRSAR